MSTADDNVSICANCGKGEEGDDIKKLKACTACKLVKYCSRECQIAHRPQHKKECRKRAAELHDIELFKQPPYQEDCPICFLRIPFLNTGWRYQTCCGTVICSGCSYSPVYDNQGNEVDNQKCAFCRVPVPKTDSEEELERMKKRVEAGDPIANYDLGCAYRDGARGLPQDYTKSLKLFHQAAELGYSEAYVCIGFAHSNGRGVENKKKAEHYYELAAKGGNVSARYNLGIREMKTGNMDRALKHFMIAAGSGDSDCLNCIKDFYSNGHGVTKEDYMKALKLYQVYLGEIKSDQRDKAAAADEENRYY